MSGASGAASRSGTETSLNQQPALQDEHGGADVVLDGARPRLRAALVVGIDAGLLGAGEAYKRMGIGNDDLDGEADFEGVGGLQGDDGGGAASSRSFRTSGASFDGGDRLARSWMRAWRTTH